MLRAAHDTRLACALVALTLATTPLVGQRLADLDPGTLVRLSTRSGAILIGPLAEVRADTVRLSTTAKSPEVMVLLRDVQGYEYADGTEPGHGLLGAMIGGAVGVTLALLLSASDDGAADGSMFLSGGFVRGSVVVLGSVIGAAVGSSDAAPHWVLPSRLNSGAGLASSRAGVVGVTIRF
jgi:hypothetical protein